jgi:cytochrome c biogenesis protein CcmG/thiol:disulfide interchange protein DsbE
VTGLRRSYLPLVATGCGAALIALLVFGVLALGKNRTLDSELAAGRPPLAPDATLLLPRLEGGYGSLAEYRGRYVLLNFWASWCPPCEQEAPLIAKAQAELSRYGGTVLGVSYKDSRSEALAFLKAHHLTFPNLRDRTGAFAEAFGTEALPESFLIDPAGRIVEISRGEIDPQFLEKAASYLRGTTRG